MFSESRFKHYQTGDAIIDAHHRNILSLADDTMEHLIKWKECFTANCQCQVNNVIQNFIDALTDHINEENKFMDDNLFQYRDIHKKIHEHFLIDVKKQ
jgi:hemerythrin